MKFHKVLQFLSLLLALIIGGQEIVHKLFHLPRRYQCLSPGKPELNSPGDNHSAPKAHIEDVCPLCNSTEDKLMPEVCIQTESADCGAPIYALIKKFPPFFFFIRPVSRGPPPFI
jgi:hypothetical protein